MTKGRKSVVLIAAMGMIVILVVAAFRLDRGADAPSPLEARSERSSVKAGVPPRRAALPKTRPSSPSGESGAVRQPPLAAETVADAPAAEATTKEIESEVESGPKLSVELRFLGPDGAPIPDLLVDVDSYSSPTESLRGTSDAAGRVRLLGWRPGVALAFSASRPVPPFLQVTSGRILGSSSRPSLLANLDPAGEWLIGPPRERIVFYDGAFVRADVVVEPRSKTLGPCLLRLSAASGLRPNFDENFEVTICSASNRERRQWFSGRMPMEIRLEEGDYEVEADQIHAMDSDFVGRQHLGVAHATAPVRVTPGTTDLALELRDTIIVKGRFVGPERSAIDAGSVVRPIIDGVERPTRYFSIAIYDLFYVGFPEGTTKAELSLRMPSPGKGGRVIDCSERVRKARAGDVIDLGEIEIK